MTVCDRLAVPPTASWSHCKTSFDGILARLAGGRYERHGSHIHAAKHAELMGNTRKAFLECRVGNYSDPFMSDAGEIDHIGSAARCSLGFSPAAADRR